MKRSALERKTPLRAKIPMARGESTLARTPIKKKARKHRPEYHDKRMLDACRGEHCYLNVPGVCRNTSPDTVVPCHGNWHDMGKGAGIKARDEFTVPGCSECHYWLDFVPAEREVKRSIFKRALARWVLVRAVKLAKGAK